MKEGVGSLAFGPDARRPAGSEKFEMDQIGIAAHGAIFHIFLVGAAGRIERDDNLLAARRADI
jgi:hypothetical protein